MSDMNWGGSADEPDVRRFYSARTAPPEKGADPRETVDYGDYTPNEEYAEPEYTEPEYTEADYSRPAEFSVRDYDREGYTPNEEYAAPEASQPDYLEPDYADEAYHKPSAAQPKPDYSAYYRADAAADKPSEQPTYAPPKRLDLRGTLYLSMTQDASDEPPKPRQTQAPAQLQAPVEPQASYEAAAQPQINVYRPREATWADTERRVALSAEDYQVRDEEPARRTKKPHGVRNTIIILLVLALLGGAGYIYREPLLKLFKQVTGADSTPEPSYEPVTTPAPVRGYDEAPKTELSEGASKEIDSISGSLTLESCAITAQNVLTRTKLPNGLYDYYLFTSNGRLLCYFEQLGENDMTPSENGGFYVRQSPYLIKDDGSALIKLDGLEKTLGKKLALRQLLNGWAVLAYEDGTSSNYMNAAGEQMSTLWFSRAYPFTGAYTAAYVDTGVSGSAERYILYTLSNDGNMVKWFEAPDMDDVTASACSAAYMRTGELFRLSDTNIPFARTDEATFYPDCAAIVVRNPDTGKYGLYVGGEKHYDYLYDSIKPVVCDIKWDKKKYSSQAGSATICAVTEAEYPMPLSHYFELLRNGYKEYVALSAVSGVPILLDEQP